MLTQRPHNPEMESCAGLLLRHRGRTGLTQRELAERIGASVRTVENWEGGVNYPSAKPMPALIAALLESRGMTVGRELDEARELSATARRYAPPMHTSSDEVWLAAVLAENVSAQAND